MAFQAAPATTAISPQTTAQAYTGASPTPPNPDTHTFVSAPQGATIVTPQGTRSIPVLG